MSRTIRGMVWVDVDVTRALRALRGMPKDASKELRAASVAIVAREVPKIQAAGKVSGKQAAAAASSVRARSDRVPAIAVGGSKRVTKGRGKGGRAGQIFFGSEAGSVDYKQFPPPSHSRWFWDTLGKDSKSMMREWGQAYDRAVTTWGDRRGN